LGLPAPGSAGSLGATRNLLLPGPAPTVTNVTSPDANGTYGAGVTLTVSVTFSASVVVTGTPVLTLETGAVDSAAPYIGGSGTNTLLFRYSVGAADSSPDLDYVSAAALALSGGTLQSATGVAANLALPAPGAAGSLA